jgi:hypothetical protein
MIYTPYGGRLEFLLPKGTPFVIHLKDGKKVKNKKVFVPFGFLKQKLALIFFYSAGARSCTCTTFCSFACRSRTPSSARRHTSFSPMPTLRSSPAMSKRSSVFCFGLFWGSRQKTRPLVS